MKPNTFSLVLFALLTYFAPTLGVEAVVPPPDGGYPNFTTAEGTNALQSLTTGSANTAVGWRSLFATTDGSFNTGVGGGALVLNTADSNTAVGAAALLLNTTGDENVAVGTAALVYNDSGRDNSAVGAFALYNNVGSYNTALGADALFDNITCTDNTAVGDAALSFNDVTGAGLANNNTAVGSLALTFNTDGDKNTAVGALALFDNTTGADNTATGFSALHNNTEGSNNTAIGHEALNHSTGSVNTALGSNAGSGVITANSVTCIGADVAGADVSETTWIGNVYGVTTQSGTTAPVIVSDSGQLGTVASSQRFKKNIAAMENASEAVLSLRPVTFHYKTDTNGTPQFGLIAEEVAKVNPALVLPDKEGKPYTVRYDAVNAMLLNEFLKEHSKNEEQGRDIQEQKATIALQQKQIEALTVALQKVNAQLEVSKPAPQTVLNNQ
jgi:trimeric autotransporter adhesin